MNFSRRLATASLPVVFVAVAGGLVTAPGLDSWYADLAKPIFNPPNWIFGPVWTLLYLTMIVAFFLVLRDGTGTKRQTASRLFFWQLGFNLLWSVTFFGLQAPWLAVGTILLLLGFLIATTRVFFTSTVWAGWLMVPYVAWVSFATILNISVALLN